MKRFLTIAVLLCLAPLGLRADQASDAQGALDAVQGCDGQVQQVQSSTAISSPSMNSFDQVRGQLDQLKPYVDSVVSHLSGLNLPAAQAIESVSLDMQVKIVAAQGAVTSLNFNALVQACQGLKGDLGQWQSQYGGLVTALQAAAQQPSGQQAQAVATAVAPYIPGLQGPTPTAMPTSTPVPQATATPVLVPTVPALPPTGNGGLIPGGFVPNPPTPTPQSTPLPGQPAPTPQPFAALKAPLPVAAAHNGQTVWVANVQAGSVGVFDVVSERFVAQVPVGSNPSSLGLDDGDNVLAVANAGSASVTLIDARANTVLKTLSVGATPAQVLVTHSGVAYVACQDGHSIAVIDLSRRLLLATISLSSRPGRMDQPNSSAQVYVTLPDEDSVGIIDTGSQSLVAVVKE